MAANAKTHKKYICNLCDVKCFSNFDLERHKTTRKHEKAIASANNGNVKTDFAVIEEEKNYVCLCGKKFSHSASLSRHKKNCDILSSGKELSDVSSNKLDVITTAMIDLMKNNETILMENKEFKELLLEQNKQMMELMNTKMMGNITNNTNSHNKFNLNLFLNEQCKDAMNISDFIKSLEISFEDFENVGTLGYAEGISNILINNLKKTEIEKRPMHCSDLKRETMYIKDKDTWENDKEKTIFISAIKGAAHQNFMKSVDWKMKHPDYRDSASKTMDKYNKILYETCGPESKEEKEKEYNKILRRVAKEITIDK